MTSEIAVYNPVIENVHSIPQWVTSQLALVSGQHRDSPLPVSLTPSQQNTLKQKITFLDYHLKERPDDIKTLSLMMEFILATSTANFSDKQLEAKGMAFVTSMRELPAWAIAEAIQKWHKGEVGFKVDYNFPTPADLRKVALACWDTAAGKMIVYQRLLEASNQEPFSEVHQTTMLEKIKGLFTGFNKAAFEKRQGR